MDWKITTASPCGICGELDFTFGVCSACTLRGSVSFWNLVDGRIDLAAFLANLRAFEPITGPVFPVAGDAITCGKRTDVPKKMRRHLDVSLGTDTRNFGTLGLLDCEIFACVRCGRDRKGPHHAILP